MPLPLIERARMASRYWRLDGFGGVDLLRADASTHRYARHSHEGYALGVVEAGAHSFPAPGEGWAAIPGRGVILHPHLAPDRGPVTPAGGYSHAPVPFHRAEPTPPI